MQFYKCRNVVVQLVSRRAKRKNGFLFTPRCSAGTHPRSDVERLYHMASFLQDTHQNNLVLGAETCNNDFCTTSFKESRPLKPCPWLLGRCFSTLIIYLWPSRCRPAGVAQQVSPSRCRPAGVAQQVSPSRCRPAGVAQQVSPSRCRLAGVAQQVSPSR